LVDGVSKLGKLRYPRKGLTVKDIESREEQPLDMRAESLRKMFFAMAEDLRVILIKLADRLHNMQTLDALPEEKRKRIALETLEIFAPLANRLGMGEMKGQLEDLSFPYLYPQEYKWLRENIGEEYEERKKYLKKVKEETRKILEKEGIEIVDIHARAKHYWSLYQKLIEHEMDLSKVYDLVALRIILKDVESCYKALGAIHKNWKPLPRRIKDYIALPKPNEYRALHTTVFCINGKITEFQIKTEKMHQEAENGICAHWAKKEKIDSKKGLKKFSWVAQLRDWQKEITKSKDFWEGLKIDFFKNRIFVFTPKGEVVDLPEEACPIDFAYQIHSEIGDHCAGAKINKKMKSLSTPLSNGDEVEIITDSSQKPSRDWLDFVKTNLSRSRIKAFLKKESRPKNLKRGKEILNEKLKELKKPIFQKIQKEKREKALDSLGLKNEEELMIAIGEGEVSPRELIKLLFKEEDLFGKTKQKKEFRKKTKENDVVLAGESGIKTKFAKCCLPSSEHEIEGYITKGKGATIHRKGCKNLERLRKRFPEKVVQARWKKEESYPVSLKVEAEDRKELLKDITFLISEEGTNIDKLKSQLKKDGKTAIVRIDIKVSGLKQLNEIIYKIKELENIISVRKINS
jgi:GTP pyrophosphokinase